MQESDDSDEDELNDDQLLGAILKSSQNAGGKSTEEKDAPM